MKSINWKIPIFQRRVFTPSNEYLTDIMENKLKLFSRLFLGFFAYEAIRFPSTSEDG